MNKKTKLLLIAVLALLPTLGLSQTKIKTSGITDGAVTTAKLAGDSVTAGKIVDGAVGTAEIDADAVTASEIAESAVGTSEIADGTVAAVDLSDTLDLSAKTVTLPAGHVVQVVNTQTGAVATGTTTVPNDDTIPQITEGTEFMTLAITPASATNKLMIEVVFVFAGTAGNPNTLALFQDATANALAAVMDTTSAANLPQTIVLRHYMTAGTTSATTFRVRFGPSSAGTVTFNGLSAGRKLGGVMASSITITEIKQ